MTRTVFQFLGCYYHGCPVCFPDPTKMHPQKHVRFADLLKSTEGHLINLGANYQVVSIWECQWKAQYTPTEYDQELSNIILDRDELFMVVVLKSSHPIVKPMIRRSWNTMMSALYIQRYAPMIPYPSSFQFGISVPTRAHNLNV